MNYIVMDLEFNQPFDFSKHSKTKANPQIPFEIVQIGCIKLDDKFKQIDSFNMYIKPAVYKRIHPYVQKITGINSQTFKGAIGFNEVYEKFCSFIGDEESIFCVWGDVDLKSLYNNISYYNLDISKMPKKYINVQAVAGKKLSWENGRRIGLKNAIEIFEIDVKEPFHDAFNDAFYTSVVLKKLNITDDMIKTFSVESKTSNKKNQTNLAELYLSVEKELGRKVGRREKNIIRNIYFAGVKKKYDITDNEQS